LYSRKKNAKTGKRRNLGTFKSLEKIKAHERPSIFQEPLAEKGDKNAE
jgi:hypothetical protein